MRFTRMAMIVAAAAMLAACAQGLTGYQTKVDPLEEKYIEAETNLKQGFATMGRAADAEQAARKAGNAPGSVITKAAYDRGMTKLGQLKDFTRQAHALSANVSCMKITNDEGAAIFPDLNLSGCLNRESAVLLALAILSQINAGTP